MSFLTSLLGSEHLERFIPLATGKAPEPRPARSAAAAAPRSGPPARRHAADDSPQKPTTEGGRRTESVHRPRSGRRCRQPARRCRLGRARAGHAQERAGHRRRGAHARMGPRMARDRGPDRAHGRSSVRGRKSGRSCVRIAPKSLRRRGARSTEGVGAAILQMPVADTAREPTTNSRPAAGLPRRLAALVYDSLLLLALLMIATACFLPFTGGEAVTWSTRLCCSCCTRPCGRRRSSSSTACSGPDRATRSAWRRGDCASSASTARC